MKIVVFKGKNALRGAIMPNPQLFISMHKECFLIESEDVAGIIVYNFNFSLMHGKTPYTWALRWLHKASKTAAKMGTFVPTQHLRSETNFSINDMKQAHNRESMSNTSKLGAKKKRKSVNVLFNSAQF
jgi:hypothetical protein